MFKQSINLRVGSLGIFLALAILVTGFARQAEAAKKPHIDPPQVLSALEDSGDLIITGTNLVNVQDVCPEITLDGAPVVVLNPCTPQVDDSLTLDLDGLGVLDGTLLLVVTTLGGESSFEVGFGFQEPKGDTGDDNTTFTASCPAGTYLVGLTLGVPDCKNSFEDNDNDGYTVAQRDCHDGNSDVRPFTASFHEVPYTNDDGTTSFDYDCSGFETRLYAVVRIRDGEFSECDSTELFSCLFTGDWQDWKKGIVPECGEQGTSVRSSYEWNDLGGFA
jgi:hypothetical protein